MVDVLFSSVEAGRSLRMTDAGVRRLVRLGRLPLAYMTAAGKFLFRPGDVELLRRQRAAAKAERREKARKEAA